jgi:hypothetical protein
MERFTGGAPVDELDAADFNQAIPGERIKPGGFGIEDNLAHSRRSPVRITGAAL